ncbi:MAG: methyltransferase [Planctomycetes bacterium]|nr:methyltransferase [Planctomycetota bacterium]
MSRAFFNLDRIDPDSLRRVASALRSAGYSERGVQERLCLEDITELELEAFPFLLKHRLRKRSPLDVAIALFLLQDTATEEELGELFDASARKLLRTSKILAADPTDRTYRARVSLYPVAEKLFFTDHRYAHTAWHKARVDRDPVMFLDTSSYWLARTTVRRPVRNVLDLGTGCGLHAILAAESAERVVGVDINRRAVNFARLNAILNDAWNAVFVDGDLFTPVGKERFDLIIANPPCVAAPTYRLSYRDGGPSGADVLRRVIAHLPDHLSTEGSAHVVTQIAERDGEPYLDRIRRWLGGANMNLHSLRVNEQTVLEFATHHTKQVFGERYGRFATQLMDWVTNMRAQRFRRVISVVLTAQWNEDGPHSPWTQEDECKPPTSDFALELARLLHAKRRVRTLPSLEALSGMRLGIPDDLLLIERRQPTGDGFDTKDFRVEFKNARMSSELDVKPLVRDLLERIDNRATVPEVIKRLAEDTGQEAAAIDERCRKALLVMFERGLVTLDELSSISSGTRPVGIPSGPAHRTQVQSGIDPRAISAESSAADLFLPPDPGQAPR